MSFLELLILHGEHWGGWQAEAKRRADMSGFPQNSFKWNDIFWGYIYERHMERLYGDREGAHKDISRVYPMKKE